MEWLRGCVGTSLQKLVEAAETLLIIAKAQILHPLYMVPNGWTQGAPKTRQLSQLLQGLGRIVADQRSDNRSSGLATAPLAQHRDGVCGQMPLDYQPIQESCHRLRPHDGHLQRRAPDLFPKPHLDAMLGERLIFAAGSHKSLKLPENGLAGPS